MKGVEKGAISFYMSFAASSPVFGVYRPVILRETSVPSTARGDLPGK
jgi:hypothetical protein